MFFFTHISCNIDTRHFIMAPPLKIEVEGIDAAGKTTAVTSLVDMFRQKGLRTLRMSEAGFDEIDTCVRLRKLALDPASTLSPLSMELLFAAQRVENDLWLKKHAEDYDVIISDRGYISHLAYGYANVGRGEIDVLFNVLLHDVAQPDVVVYLDISPEVAAQRLRSRGGATDRIEEKGITYQTAVLENFHQLQRSWRLHFEGTQLVVIDASQSKEDVVKAVSSQLNALDLF